MHRLQIKLKLQIMGSTCWIRIMTIDDNREIIDIDGCPLCLSITTH